MNKFNAHPMFLVAESVQALRYAFINAERTAGDYPLQQTEIDSINSHIDSLNQLFNTYQQRIKQS
jgi:hypothetical protein